MAGTTMTQVMTNKVVSAAIFRQAGIVRSRRRLSGSNSTAATTAQRIAPEKGAISYRKANVAATTAVNRNPRASVTPRAVSLLVGQRPMGVSQAPML